VVGFAIVILSLGLFSTLNQDSSTAEWVIFQMLGGLGSGMILNTLLPAFQAGIQESDQAAATASWAFIRSFGNIWGVAIPAVIFNNRFGTLAYRISDPDVRSELSGGSAYEHASQKFLLLLPESIRNETRGVYVEALKLVWYVSVALCGAAFVLALFEKELELRKELETEYGLEKIKPVGKSKKEMSSD